MGASTSREKEKGDAVRSVCNITARGVHLMLLLLNEIRSKRSPAPDKCFELLRKCKRLVHSSLSTAIDRIRKSGSMENEKAPFYLGV